jgi:hypothetical protein
MDHGAQTDTDLRELWSRIVFNLLVSNTDDHLRNHGFILVPGKGWRLSPAYDMNPVPESHGLKLNISESDNALDLDLARSVAPYFRVDAQTANAIIEHGQRVCSSGQKSQRVWVYPPEIKIRWPLRLRLRSRIDDKTSDKQNGVWFVVPFTAEAKTSAGTANKAVSAY